MALKKRTTKSQGEQLYMLEVFVERITLNPKQTSGVNVEDLTVCMRFIDLPECEISVPNKEIDSKKNNKRDGNSNDFKYSKSCLFSKTPSSLIKAIRWSSLCLDVYHRKSTSSTKKNRALLGTAKVSLPACVCNYVANAQKESNGSSTPSLVKDTYDLINSNGITCGSMSVALRLSCFGSSIVKQFSMGGKAFILENSPLQKFICPYLAPESTKGEEESRNEEKPLLKRPESPPRISINDPAFKTLTTAEKMNDPKYRDLVYRAYPDEPTCPCLPADRTTHPLKCRSGCSRPCCMKLRNPNILDSQENRHVEDALANTYCVNNFLSALYALKQDSPCGNGTRLRGGGDIEQIYMDPASLKWVDYDTDYTWYDEKNNVATRLEGGGGGEKDMSSCSCSGSPVPVPPRKSSSKDKDVVTTFDACKPRVVSGGPKPSCICPGKETPTWPRGAAKCMKKPCMGIDCLVRAFKEAQEFVDSIGKVPGLPGLGLMDPSESPYFGRDIDKDYVPQEPPPEPQRKKAQAGTPQRATTPTCTAPCSMQMAKAGDDLRPRIPSPYAPTAGLGLPVPPRLGIVREAIPVLPEVGSTIGSAKRKVYEKRDEKIDKHKELDGKSFPTDTEVGPCGEPKCKSRRKKPADVSSITHSATVISSKTRTGMKRSGASHRRGRMSKGKGKRRAQPSARGNTYGKARTSSPQFSKAGSKVGGKGKQAKSKDSPLGPGGDRSPNLHQSIVVSRPIMRYVYFVGDYYPGVVYGHKNCIDIPMRVPANMGWLWNTMATAGNLKPRIGWRPGAIGRYLYEMLQEAKENSLALEESTTSVSTRTTERGRTGTERGRARIDRGRGGIERGRAGATRGRTGIGRGRAGIERGRGRTAAERARSAPSRGKSSRRQRVGKAMSFQAMQQSTEGEEEGPEPPPTLHIHRKDGTYYVTMYPIKQETPGEPRLTEPMKPLQFKIVKNKDDASAASSSTASDMEIEFSPPAAVSRYRKKPDVVHVDTQVRQQEILEAMKSEAVKKKDRRRREKKAVKK